MIKKLICFAIGLIPINFVKILLFRSILKFDIKYSAKIGVGIYLVDIMVMGKNSSIGRFNIFKNVEEIIVNDCSKINHKNKFFSCKKIQFGNRVNFKSYNTVSGKKTLLIGSNTIINSYNHFDLASDIVIGENVTFGGRGIEIWTHGFNHKRKEYIARVIIGNNVYLGSGVKIKYGVNINDNVTVGMGTIVSKDLTEKNAIYISSKIEIIKILEEGNVF